MAKPFETKYTEEALRDKVFDLMLELDVKYAPTWPEIKPVDKSFVIYLKKKFGTYENFAKYYKLQTKVAYELMINPIEITEKHEQTMHEIKTFLKSIGINYMPSRAVWLENNQKTLYNKLCHHFDGVQKAAVVCGIEYKGWGLEV